MAEPLRVVITGAAGQIAYSLLYSVTKGDVFGKDQPIILHLLDIDAMMSVLTGVVMEMQDCALPLLVDVLPTSDPVAAFKDVDAAILVGAMPRKEGMERKDLLKANVKIFKVQGQALDQHAKKTVKVLVVGNPANTNALICRKYAPSIPSENFSCLTRLDQNRAVAQAAAKAGVGCRDVRNVIIWGNHSSTQYPDLAHAQIKKGNDWMPASQVIQDDAWANQEFVSSVQQRGAQVIAQRKLSSAMSAAKAICDHMRDWWFGTAPGSWVSMGVITDDSKPYDIESNLMYSFPVTIGPDRKVSIVPNLSISDKARERMETTAKELIEERNAAIEVCGE